jgi:hypothetical protein
MVIAGSNVTIIRENVRCMLPPDQMYRHGRYAPVRLNPVGVPEMLPPDADECCPASRRKLPVISYLPTDILFFLPGNGIVGFGSAALPLPEPLSA